MLKCHVLTTRLPLIVLIGFPLDTDQYEYECLDITEISKIGTSLRVVGNHNTGRFTDPRFRISCSEWYCSELTDSDAKSKMGVMGDDSYSSPVCSGSLGSLLRDGRGVAWGTWENRT